MQTKEKFIHEYINEWKREKSSLIHTLISSNQLFHISYRIYINECCTYNAYFMKLSMNDESKVPV